MSTRLKLFRDINLNTDAVIEVLVEDFNSPGEDACLAAQIYLADHTTMDAFWDEVSEVSKRFRHEGMCRVLNIKIPIIEVRNEYY